MPIAKPVRSPVTYAIAFDLDTQILQKIYPNASWNNAYYDIREFLESNGFIHQQGLVYFGGETIDPVTCVIVTQKLSEKFAWFTPAVRDIRMLRIDDNNDLKPALKVRPA
jgi:virulence-associated protein VapD